MKILVITSICLTALLCGCALKYEDVSDLAEYSHFVKNRYTLNTDMYIQGVNLPPSYGDDVNIYSIYPIEYGKRTGPEILSEDILKPGTVLEIQNIKRSINNLPRYQNVDAIVTVTPYDKEADVPVKIPLQYLQSTNWVSEK